MQDLITNLKNRFTKKQLIIFGSLFAAILILAVILAVVSSDSGPLGGDNTPPVDPTDPGYASNAAISAGEQETKNYPIISLLPITNSVYKLGYNYDDRGDFYVSVKVNADFYLDSAIQKLTSLSISILDYRVLVRDYTSPFATSGDSHASDAATFLHDLYPNVEFSVVDLTTSSADSSYTLANLTTGSEQTYSLITHHAILHRTGDSWELVSPVYPIITKKSAPSAPEAVLREIRY